MHTGNILKHRAVRLPTPGIADYNSTHGESETWRIATSDIRELPPNPTKDRFFLTTDSQSTESTVHTMVEQQPTLSTSHKSPMAQISISMRSAYLATRYHTPIIITTTQYNNEHNRTHDDDSFGDPSQALIINANAINDLAAKRASTYVDYDAVIPPPVDGPAPPYPPTDFGAAADARGSPGGPGMGTKVYYSFKGVKIDVPPRDLAHRIAAEEQAAFLRESTGITSDTARLLHAGRLSRTVASKIPAQLSPAALGTLCRMNLHRWKGNLKHTSQALKYFLGDDGELVDTALKRAGRGATPCLHCAGESSQNHDRHHCTGPPATHFYRQLARYRSAILRGLGRRCHRPTHPCWTNHHKQITNSFSTKSPMYAKKLPTPGPCGTGQPKLN